MNANINTTLSPASNMPEMKSEQAHKQLNDIVCSKKRLIMIVIVVFLILLIFNYQFESYITNSFSEFFIKNNNEKENYGMPTMSCADKNSIRLDVGLPPLSC